MRYIPFKMLVWRKGRFFTEKTWFIYLLENREFKLLNLNTLNSTEPESSCLEVNITHITKRLFEDIKYCGVYLHWL